MYKLVIIDDEKIICDLLTRLISWEDIGLTFAGMAHDGYAALDLIREEEPDIAIIDIRIPGMDGIEVISKAQKLCSHTRFLIVSGYREFDYARKACYLNVANYLVKPIDEAELNASLKQICEEKRQKEQNLEQLQDMNRRLTNQREHILRRVLEDMQSGRDHNEHVIDYLKEQGIAFDRERYTVLVIKFDIRYEILQQCMPIIEYVRRLFSDSDESVRYSCIEEGSRIIVIAGHENDSPHGLMEKIVIANEYVKTYQYCSVSFGLCSVSDSPQQFPALYYEAMSAEEMRRVRFNNVIRYDRTMPRIDYVRFPDEEIREIIQQAVTDSGFDLLQRYLDESYDSFAEKKEEYCYPAFLIRVTEIFCDYLKEPVRGELEKSINCLIWEIDNELKIYKIRHELEQSLRGLFERFLTRKLKDENYHIIQAQNYIAKHYSEDISMQRIADIVYLHPVYFSNLFKTVTGMNYLDYLQNVRIDHARKILLSSSLTIEQVANEVGYQDKRHFSRIFRRITGMNPGTYRKLYSHHVEG